MDLGSIEWLGVLVATVVVFVSGLAWFSPRAFFPVWWRAMGKGDETPGSGGGPMALVFGLTLVAIVAQVTAIALVIQAAAGSAGDVDLATGLGIGLVVGIAVAGASLGHRLFAGHGVRVWAIEVGNDVLNLALAGAILSFWY
ncbi:MAG: hypothetical protein RL338_1487 [Chloroflexota bacterium]|jgi:hypothetical protein